MPYLLPHKGSVLSLLLNIAFLLLISSNATAQIKWDGEAGDGKWATAANWVGNAVPGATDVVVLDNSIVVANYTVTLPATAVTIQSISIAANTGNSIQLLLPASNNLAPAFTATGAEYGINIGAGGVLQNSSGAASGSAIVTSDSIKINNGGQYTHNTRSAHAALVTVLSKSAGTEKGIFKFDVPGGGYVFSASNRNYGTLQFSADASGGTQTYSATGTNTFTINGDLILKTGATINLDLTGATIIKGNYLQDAGIFNIANGANNNTIYLQGDLLQTAGVITETSTGLPTIELNGSNQQRVQINGTVTNSVAVRINNNAGAVLTGNVNLPYKLTLSKGMVDVNGFLLTLLTGCTIQADSLATNCFVNGALRKEGLSAADHFLFPIGKGITQRWLELKNATGNYTVEFFKASPYTLSSINSTTIHHTSSIEYWSVKPDLAPLPSTQIALSFDNVNSGGVTAMPALRVAQLQAGIWNDAGNIATTGSAGAAGSVVSNVVNTFEPVNNYFTLGSSDAFQNPLPLLLQFFKLEQQNKTVLLKWETSGQWLPAYFELQSSNDGMHFETFATLPVINNQFAYQYADNREVNGKRYYRLRMTDNADSYIFSDQLSATNRSNVNSIAVWPSVVYSNANLVIVSTAVGKFNINICDVQGRTIQTRSVVLSVGSNTIPLVIDKFKAGAYIIQATGSNMQPMITRFIKM